MCNCARDGRCHCDKPVPHKHAEVIKAWADGAIIEHRSHPHSIWRVVENPSWFWGEEYRVKPEPKPDFFSYLGVNFHDASGQWSRAEGIDGNRYKNGVKFTWDGDTGKLKSVEIIK